MISCHICDEPLELTFVIFFRHLVDHDLDRLAVRRLWNIAQAGRS